MPPEPPETAGVPKPEDLKYLWTEYKYRHELCWKAIYKLAAVVVALGILPYAHERLTALVGGAMLVPSVIGTLLALFGVFVVNNELRLFAYAKVAHNHLHNRFLSNLITDADVRRAAIDRLPPKRARRTLFDIYAHLLMVVLFVISIGNTAFLHYCWLSR